MRGGYTHACDLSYSRRLLTAVSASMSFSACKRANPVDFKWRYSATSVPRAGSLKQPRLPRRPNQLDLAARKQVQVSLRVNWDTTEERNRIEGKKPEQARQYRACMNFMKAVSGACRISRAEILRGPAHSPQVVERTDRSAAHENQRPERRGHLVWPLHRYERTSKSLSAGKDSGGSTPQATSKRTMRESKEVCSHGLRG